jgi:hypothetical protein
MSIRRLIPLLFVGWFLLSGSYVRAADVPLAQWGRADCFTPIASSQNAVLPALAPAGSSGNFRLLRDDQRWIVLDGAADASNLFPGQEVITETIAVHPPAIAWEAADAVVFGAGRLPVDMVEPLLANGSIVVSADSARPGGPWNWQKTGSRWQTSFDIAGPRGRFSTAVYNAINLQPVGRPLWARYRVLLMAGLFALVAVAASLLPKRAALAVAVVAIGASVGIMTWSMRTEPILHTQIRVIVQKGDLEQVDQWTIEKSLDHRELHVDPKVVGWPVFRSRSQAAEMPLKISGNDLAVRLKSPLILLRREIQPIGPTPTDLQPLTPSLRPVAALYEGKNVQLVGVKPATRGHPIDVVWLAQK